MAISVEEAKHSVLTTAVRLKKNGLIPRTYGNLSARVSPDQYVITPTGRDYESLHTEDIVLVNISDGSYTGNLKPSSEFLLHQITYKLHPGAQFVVHTHQAVASAISILGENFSNIDQFCPPDMIGKFSLVEHELPTASYGMKSSKSLMKAIASIEKKYPAADAILMRNHGVLCFASSGVECFHKVMTLERLSSYIYSDLTEINYNELSIEKIYATESRKKISFGKNSPLSDQVVLFVSTPFILRFGMLKKPLYPYLDDMAMMTGREVKCLPSTPSPAELEKALMETPAVLMHGRGALCMGSDIEEARSLCLILEKGAMAAYLAEKVGNIPPLPEKTIEEERKLFVDSYSKKRK